MELNDAKIFLNVHALLMSSKELGDKAALPDDRIQHCELNRPHS